MIILAIDIGGKTRNGFCVMDSDTKDILYYSYIPYDRKSSPHNHRMSIVQEILDISVLHKPDIIVFEKINLYVGGNVSKLADILSLCRVQTAIVDNLYNYNVPIYGVDVRSWKSRSLKKANATKSDAILEVSTLYPDVDLSIDGKARINHDLADSIMMARAVSLDSSILKDSNIMNNK